mmetsp:Transcript_28431/g.60284  ORF Transcript_28431/g.60284 Transcript_28431/m.60284 type:complete len:230 (-) Transcript_28431:178-867(-)
MLQGRHPLRQGEAADELIGQVDLRPELVDLAQRHQELGPKLTASEIRGLEAHLLLKALGVPAIYNSIELLSQVDSTMDLAVQLPPPQTPLAGLTLPDDIGLRLLVALFLEGLCELVRLHSQVKLPDPGVEALRAEEEAKEDRRVHLHVALLDAALALAVVLLPRLRIGEHLVGVGQLLKLGFRLDVTWILVGVALPRLLVVRLLYVRCARGGTDLQQVVVLRVHHFGGA